METMKAIEPIKKLCIERVNKRWHERKNKQELERLLHNYDAQTSVCVTPLPRTITKEHLQSFMSTFGTIPKSHMSQNFFLVEYDTKEAVNILFNTSNQMLQNETLCLKRIEEFGKNLNHSNDKDGNLGENKIKRPKKKGKQNKSVILMTEDPLNYNINVKPLIKKIPEFENELTTLFEVIQLTEFEIKTKYDVICGHLEGIFKLVFPQCRLYRFGSTMAGLGFKNCDLDIYMSVNDIGPQTTHSDKSFQEQIILKKLKKMMYSRSTLFSNIIAIPKARTPIIKFCYVPTNVSCDIMFKNCFGIYKTNFLKFCALYDNRAKQLMQLIKYWAKEYKVTGVGKMPNYGLMCLVIFYLQTVDILPTLMELRKDQAPMFVDEWQVNFNENYRPQAASSTDDQSVVDLLHGFFSFINEKFMTLEKCAVFSLLDGKTYDKNEFNEMNSLPDYMDSYRYHVLQNNGYKLEGRNPIAVQDPIELNQNAIMNANDSMLRDFNKHCCFVVKCIENAKENNYKNLLKDLFERSLPPPMLNVKGRISIGRFLNVGLPADFDSCSDISNKLEHKKNNWCFIVFNLIKDILEMVFKFKVNVYLDNGTCIGKVDVLPDTLVRSNKEICFHCVSNKCVWYNRTKYNRIFLDVQLSYLEKEATISNYVLNELNRQEKNKQNNVNFTCKYTVTKVAKLEAVNIKLSQEKNQKNPCDLNTYLNKWILQIIDKTMAHMLQYNKPYDQLYQQRRQETSKETVNKPS